MKRSKRLSYALAATVCLAIGAMAGIAGSTASTTQKAHSSAAGSTERPPGPRPGGPGLGGPPIHSVSVVPNKQGTGFDTITADSGTFQSLSGQQLTINEGTKTLTYKTVTLTIPAGATIQRDGKSAQLSELQSGDHVSVFENSDGTTTVNAADSSFRPAGGPGGPPPGQGQNMPPAAGSGG
jgi:hypothetical protein